MTSLDGQAVLVTGANRGMGREYVTQLLDRGVAKVYATARDAGSIDATSPRVVPLQLDVTDAGSVAAAGAAASDVSVLINNAGISRGTSVLDSDTSKLREELETNLFGPASRDGYQTRLFLRCRIHGDRAATGHRGAACRGRAEQGREGAHRREGA